MKRSVSGFAISASAAAAEEKKAELTLTGGGFEHFNEPCADVLAVQIGDSSVGVSSRSKRDESFAFGLAWKRLKMEG
jgi:hypothetical protein